MLIKKARKNAAGTKKATVSFMLDVSTANMFRSTCSLNDVSMSDVIERYIRMYIIEHKTETDKKIKNFFDTTDVENKLKKLYPK